jgi:hypothetical protein
MDRWLAVAVDKVNILVARSRRPTPMPLVLE